MGDEEDIVQKLERSMDFWVEDRTDYPPAIRGVIAHSSDLRDDVREMVHQIGADPGNEALQLRRVLWFDDKNEKLDEACGQAKEAFRAYASNEYGLISWTDDNNPLMEAPTKHRLVVSDAFAIENYRQENAGDLILDDSDTGTEDVDLEVPSWSWKRKITQSLQPWRVKDGEVVKAARRPDDLMRTLNALFSLTKHGWLVVDLKKLKKRRGSIMVYARTVEYERKPDFKYEFMVQLFGTATEFRRRLAKTLTNIASLNLENDESGEVWVSRVSLFEEKPPEEAVIIPIPARVTNENGKPSQIVLDSEGKYFKAKIQPLLKPGKKMATKLDLRKMSSDKPYRFRLKLAIEGPLLVATSGNGVIFQLDEMLRRFRKTSLEKLREANSRQPEA